MGRRIDADDELDVIEFIDQDTPIAEYPTWARDGFGGFEDMVREVEAWARRVQRGASFTSRHQHQLSRATCAHQIVVDINTLRAIIRHDPAREAPIVLALSVGARITDATWRFNRGAVARQGIRRRASSRKGGIARAKQRRTQSQVTRDRVEACAKRIRRQHAYDRRSYSTRWLALTVAQQLHLKLPTVRQKLRELGLT